MLPTIQLPNVNTQNGIPNNNTNNNNNGDTSPKLVEIDTSNSNSNSTSNSTITNTNTNTHIPNVNSISSITNNNTIQQQPLQYQQIDHNQQQQQYRNDILLPIHQDYSNNSNNNTQDNNTSNQFREIHPLQQQQTSSTSHFSNQIYPQQQQQQQYQQSLLQNSFYQQQFQQFQQSLPPPTSTTSTSSTTANTNEFSYLQNNNNNTNQTTTNNVPQINQQQFSELMYNSFFSHLAAQKQQLQGQQVILPNNNQTNVIQPNNNVNFNTNPQTNLPKYFPNANNVNTSTILPPSSSSSSKQSTNNNGSKIQFKHIQTVTKKLSSTQKRIEKRKKLKKQGPKRPSSAYFLFSMSIRNDLLKDYPHAKVPELSKLASVKWKELTDSEKKPYYDEFRTNWEKYRILRDEYEKTLPPKRPSGPFIQFTQDIRPLIVKENPNKNLIEITKIIGEKWRQLNTSKKSEYTENYRTRLKEWESCYPEENDEKVTKETTKSHKNNNTNNSNTNTTTNTNTNNNNNHKVTINNNNNNNRGNVIMNLNDTDIKRS